MRVGVAVAGSALALLAACTGGDGGTRGPTGAPPVTTTSSPATTVATTSSTVPPSVDPPGAVTLHAIGFTLPDATVGSASAGGLRVLVRPASAGLTVRRRGAGGAVTACPVTSVAGPVAAAACTDLGTGQALAVAASGVELRATNADVAVDEVTVTYLPADHSLTLVTPARAAGACTGHPCQATFSLTPPQAGTFSLDGRAGGGRPRLTLSSNTGPGSSNRTLATVEGGGNLSISAALDGASEATLGYEEASSGAVPGFTAEILWP